MKRRRRGGKREKNKFINKWNTTLINASGSVLHTMHCLVHIKSHAAACTRLSTVHGQPMDLAPNNNSDKQTTMILVYLMKEKKIHMCTYRRTNRALRLRPMLHILKLHLDMSVTKKRQEKKCCIITGNKL